MKISRLRIISCILIGVVISEAISLFLFDKIPYHLGYYLSLAIGTFLAGYIAENKGWIVGLSVGVIQTLIIYITLSILTLPSLGKPSLPPVDVFFPTPLIINVVVGTVFGGLGEWARKHYLTRRKLDKAKSDI